MALRKHHKENRMNDKRPVQEKHVVDTKALTELAIYLSGVKDGKGNLLPLGTIHLDELWNAVRYLQGDSRFTAERDKKENVKPVIVVNNETTCKGGIF